MSEIIRDTFIALHSSDVLGKLQAEVRRFLIQYLKYIFLTFGSPPVHRTLQRLQSPSDRPPNDFFDVWFTSRWYENCRDSQTGQITVGYKGFIGDF